MVRSTEEQMLDLLRILLSQKRQVRQPCLARGGLDEFFHETRVEGMKDR